MSQFTIEIEAIKDAIIEQVSRDTSVLEQARSQFAFALQDKEGLVEADLLEWLVWDFKTEGKSLLEKYYEEIKAFFSEEMLKSALNSKLAFVQWQYSGQSGFFKDILTNKDFRNPIMPESADEEHIALIRFFQYDGYDVPAGEIKYYDSSLKESIRRGMLEKYNEIFATFPQTIENFIYNNPLILYAYAQIIDVVAESADNDYYVVYQATYKIIEVEKLNQHMMLSSHFSMTDDHDIYVLELPTATMAEVVIEDIRLDIEATSHEKLEEIKSFIEENLNEMVLHIQDEVLTLDDLLG